MTCPDANLLAAFGEGSLTPDERRAIEAHIDTCGECAELVADLAREAARAVEPSVDPLAGSSSKLSTDRSATSEVSDDIATVADGSRRSAEDVERSTASVERLGRYVLLERLGAGAMGQVYCAYDPELNRRVALKIIRPELRRDQSATTGRARLLREAQAAASLTHPNVITIFDVGSVGEQVFIAMELVVGVDLRRWQRATERTWEEVLDVYLLAGEGLAAAHAADLLHRDFKPDNVLRGDDGSVVVLDFGLAKQTAEPSEDAEAFGEESWSGNQELTVEGAVLGTPPYMAPEQLCGQALDARADQFSFCVALWEALHGERPFIGEGFASLRAAIMRGEIQAPAAGRRVPVWLERTLRRGLAVDRADRFDSMRALLDQLRSGRGRRRRWLTATGLGVGFLAVASAAYYQGQSDQAEAVVAPPSPCGGAADRVAEVWSDERRRVIEAAFSGSGLPFAGGSWASVARSVDGYTERWQTDYVAACEATRVHGVQSEDLLDRRMACLDRRLGQLDALLALLAEPDAAIIERAVRAVSGLPRLSACADTQSLASGQPRPSDPQLRRSIDEAFEQLGRGKALALAARYAEAQAVAQQVVERSEALDFAPLRAAALLDLGDMQDRQGDPRSAEETLREALQIAESAGDDRVAASAWASLVYVVGLELARVDEGRLYAEVGLAKSARIGDPADVRRSLLSNRAMVEYAAGDTEAARERTQEAIALVESEWGPDAIQLQSMLDLLGSIHRLRGEREQAEVAFLRALSIAAQHLGPDHPASASSHGNLAAVLYASSRYDEALEHAQRALTLFESLDAQTPFVASALNNLANIHTARDDNVEALAMHERALAVRVAIFGERHPDVAQSLDGLGTTLTALGRPAEALPRHRQALEIRVEVHGEQHPFASYSYQGIGRALLSLDRPAEAVEPLSAALALRTEPHDFDPTERGETELALAEALFGAHQEHERARDLLASATEHLPDDPTFAQARSRVRRLADAAR